MATTYLENGLNTPNGSHLAFSYSFPVLKTEDVKVALNGVTQATTKYAVDNTSNPTRITFNNTNIDSDLQESTGAPKTGVIVRVYRDTDVDAAKGVFAAGSSIRAADLNNNQDQVLYALQEEQNQKGIFESISLDDNVSIKLGNSDDATIKYDGNELDIQSAGQVEIDGTYVYIDGPFRVRPNVGIRLLVDDTEVRTLADFKPYNTNSYDLGKSDRQWKDLYIDGTGYIDTISADTATINGNLVVTGTISDSGGNLELADDVNISGHIRLPDDKKLYLGNGDDASIDWDTDGWFDRLEITSAGDIKTTAGDGKYYAWYIGSTFVSQWFNDRIEYRVSLRPQSNNSLDLGTSTLQWKDLYVDGTGYIDTVNADDITGSAIVTSGTSTSDTKVYSAKRSDALYFAKASGEEIASGETWVADDNKIATTAAIDARIVDLVDDVGGFVPIANETSFPNANPDVNNGAGTLVSVPLANTITATLGIITIPNGTVGNSTVTIIGCDSDSATYAAGFGIIVETTTTLNTYTFHRYVPKATEVTTVAGSIANVNTTAGAIANVNTVAGISGNVTTVAGIASNVTTVANDETDIGTVAGSIANINTTAGSIANVNTTAGAISNVNTVAGISSNVTTVAGISSNVTTVAGDTTAINNITTNLSAVQNAATNATNAASSATAAAGSATTASGHASTAETHKNTASTQATNSASSATASAASATSASSSASTATTQASTATTQASNASTSAANALAYKNLALTYRNDANGILTQVESAPYNLADSASTHTAWGNITDTGATAVFANESSNIHLTMSEGSSSYNYGSIT